MNYKCRLFVHGAIWTFLLLRLNFISYGQVPKAVILQQFKKDQLAYGEFEKLHGHYVKTANVLMHYLTWGDPKNTPLIWSHGSLMNAYELAPVAKALTNAGYYLIAIDYYGHGKTPIPEKDVSLYHTADDIRVLMDSLNIKKAVVGGFSRGGYIASAFYQTYHDRVSALILEDGGSVAFNNHYHRMSASELEKKAETMNLSPAIDSLYNKEYASAFAAYESLYDQQTGGSQFEIMALLKPAGNKWITYKGLMGYFGMANDKDFKNLVLRPEITSSYAASITYIAPKVIFRNLSVPVLIFDPVSNNDPMPFKEQNIELTEAHPGLITRKEYDGIEHNIHYAKPQQFANDVIAFLNKVRSMSTK